MLNVSAGLKIRPYSPADVNAVLEIQNLCKPAAAWGPHDYEQVASDPRGIMLVAEFEGCVPPDILGFAVAYQVDEEAELWNIAVVPQYRRQGIARSLLQEVCRRLAVAGVRKLLLEVRMSNTHARELYRSHGFTLLLTRKGYYQNPQEDALVLVRELVPVES